MPYFAPTLSSLVYICSGGSTHYLMFALANETCLYTDQDILEWIQTWKFTESVPKGAKSLKNTIEVFCFCFRPPTLLKLSSFKGIFKDFAKVNFCHVFQNLFNVVKIIFKKIFLIKYFMGSSINEVHKKWSIFQPLSSPAPCP